MILDYHMHLVGDDDPYTDEVFAAERVRRYVDAAAVAGVDEIGFTDHVHRFAQARDWFDHPLWTGDAVADLDRYVATVANAAADGLPVKLGLECDYLAGREAAIAELLDAHELDFVLGSVHWVAGLAVDWDEAPVWEHHSVDEVWRMYADAVSAAATSGLFDSMSHPDLAKVFGHRPDPKPRALYDQMADAFAEGGVCAEVSTAGYRRALGELYPDPELLELFGRRGVPVTLGSDAHAPEGVGAAFGRALEALHAAGYRTITRFTRRRREQVGFA